MFLYHIAYVCICIYALHPSHIGCVQKRNHSHFQELSRTASASGGARCVIIRGGFIWLHICLRFDYTHDLALLVYHIQRTWARRSRSLHVFSDSSIRGSRIYDSAHPQVLECGFVSVYTCGVWRINVPGNHKNIYTHYIACIYKSVRDQRAARRWPAESWALSASDDHRRYLWWINWRKIVWR